MDPRWQAILPGVLIVLIPPLLLWPLPLAGGDALISSPWSEGPRHLWGYWAAQQAGEIASHTDLLNHPVGQEVQLIDPLHLVPYLLGNALGGPALGFNFVLCFGLMVGGLAGWLLARVTGASAEGQILGTCIGLSIPGLLAIGVDGITEGLGAGWVGIQLATLIMLLREPRVGRIVLLGFAGAACAWSGPYNAVWMAMVDLPVLAWCVRRPMDRRALWNGILGLGLAGILAAPCLGPALRLAGDRPGSAARALPMAPDAALPWRGSWREGADLLDLFTPGFLSTEIASVPTTAYLGCVLLVAVIMGARRWRGSRPWVLGMAGMALLALGPWWVVGGDIWRIGSWAVPAPAALVEEIPVLDRISRWYRAGAVAVLLAIPVAVRALPGRRLLWLAPLVLLDGRFGGPLPVLLPTIPMPSIPSSLAGPVAELPRAHPMFPPEHPLHFPGRTADLNLLLQIGHAQSTSATLNQLPSSPAVSAALSTLENQLMRPDPSEALAHRALEQLRQEGYRSLLLVPGAMHPLPGPLRGLLGQAAASGDRWQVFSLAESSLDLDAPTGQ